jgi:CysZ protein
MVRALLLSAGDLLDRVVLVVLAKSLALTLLVFAAVGGALWWLARGWTGDALAGVIAVVAAVGAGWLLFRAVAVAVVGLFGDEIVEAVERRHYPAALATARPVPFARSLALGLRSAARVIAANLLLLPAYLVLLATGVGTAALFFAVNAWLLGRDLGDMVAARHLPAAELAAWRRRTAGRRFLMGLAGTGLFVVPGLNLLAPVLGAAMATHLFHRSRA